MFIRPAGNSFLVFCAMFAAVGCSTAPKKNAAIASANTQKASTDKSPRIEVEKLNQAIERLSLELTQLKEVERGGSKKELRTMVEQFGSVEALQANLKVLEELKLALSETAESTTP